MARYLPGRLPRRHCDRRHRRRVLDIARGSSTCRDRCRRARPQHRGGGHRRCPQRGWNPGNERNRREEISSVRRGAFPKAGEHNSDVLCERVLSTGGKIFALQKPGSKRANFEPLEMRSSLPKSSAVECLLRARLTGAGGCPATPCVHVAHGCEPRPLLEDQRRL